MDNVEVNGAKVGGDSSVKLTINTLIKIIGGLFIVFNTIAGWAYFDLRSQLKNATEISSDEKKEFLEEIEDDYDGKFEKMFEDVSEMKGDIKVILDRQNRENPITPNPTQGFQQLTPGVLPGANN